MAEGNNRYICLKLADKSLYSLYKSGQAGDRTIVVTPAVEGQEKNEISLFDCTGGQRKLLRDILLENPGEMTLRFSLGHGYLSYRVSGQDGEILDKGLIELSTDGRDLISSGDIGKDKPALREKGRPRTRWGLILFSVVITLSLLLMGGYFLADRTGRSPLPPLTSSEMPPR